MLYHICLHNIFTYIFQANFYLNITLFWASYCCITQPFIYAKIAFTFFIISNEITTCYPMNVHQSMFCYIYILHIFKHNALGLHLTLSMLNYIHYRTNWKHAFYFNKKNTIKTKKIIKISNSKYKIYFYFFKIKKIFNFILLYWGNFISRTLPLYMSHFIFKIFPYFWGL